MTENEKSEEEQAAARELESLLQEKPISLTEIGQSDGCTLEIPDAEYQELMFAIEERKKIDRECKEIDSRISSIICKNMRGQKNEAKGQN